MTSNPSNGLLLGGIADDLTGGLELAAMLVAEGVPTLLATSAEDVGTPGSARAIVVAQKTRIAPVEDAVARADAAAEMLLRHGARQLFFKYCATFDSTDKGNIGPCMDVLTERTGSKFTACCPTFPEYRRAVFQGHMFVNDRLLSESPKRHDPVTPMTDPDLVRVLQRQTKRRAGLIPHDRVRAGAASITEHVAALRAQGVDYAIADAALHEDLAAVAEACVDWPLMTGGSSVAAHYPRFWRERGLLAEGTQAVTLPAVAGAGVVLAGSCADQTRLQLDRFAARHPVLALDLRRAAAGEDVVAQTVAWAASRLSEGPVAIATSAVPEEVERLQAEFGVAACAQIAEDLLGRIAAELKARGVRRFVIAGGETSGAVLQCLGITRLVVGPFAAASLPLALDANSEGDPLVVCLKSGKLGGTDAFEQALQRMQHPTQGESR